MNARSVLFQLVGFVWFIGAVLLYCRFQFDSTWLVDRNVMLCIIACYAGIGSIFLALADIVCKRD